MLCTTMELTTILDWRFSDLTHCHSYVSPRVPQLQREPHSSQPNRRHARDDDADGRPWSTILRYWEDQYAVAWPLTAWGEWVRLL